jgi:tetratricopeptide (TPR) repeat protein
MMNRHLRTCVAVVGLLVIGATAHAGTRAKIEGRVTDLEGNPIAGATVTITTSEISSYEKVITADENGKFQTLILDATRSYVFHVEAEGFQAEQSPFKVGAGSTDNFFEFKLQTEDQADAARGIRQLEEPGYRELEEGKEFLAAGDKEAARGKFAEAITAKPDLIEAHARFAQLTYESGDMAGALAAARSCLEVDQESNQCLAVAINTSGELGENAARTEYLARYQKLNPDDPTILFNEAAVFLNNLDDEGARPLLERCLSANPDFPECNFEYGMLLLRSGDMEGAKEHLQRYLEIAPDGPLASTAEETIKYL